MTSAEQPRQFRGVPSACAAKSSPNRGRRWCLAVGLGCRTALLMTSRDLARPPLRTLKEDPQRWPRQPGGGRGRLDGRRRIGPRALRLRSVGSGVARPVGLTHLVGAISGCHRRRARSERAVRASRSDDLARASISVLLSASTLMERAVPVRSPANFFPPCPEGTKISAASSICNFKISAGSVCVRPWPHTRASAVRLAQRCHAALVEVKSEGARLSAVQ